MSEENHSPKCNFIHEFDLFGRDIDIYYKGKSNRTSCIGRVFTILYILLYITFFLYKLIRMINKSDVTFYDTYAFNGEPPSIHLNPELFYAGFAILDPMTMRPYIDPRIYGVKVIYTKGVKNAVGWDFQNFDIPLEPCNISKFGTNYRGIFKDKYKLVENFNCISDLNQVLEGHLTYDVYSYYTVKFFPCSNSTQNDIVCKSPLEIAKKLSKFGVTFMMEDVDLTPYNYHKPIEYRAKELTASVTANLFQEIRAFLQVVNIETDEDILGFEALNSVKKEKYIKYDEAQILSRLKPNNFPYTNETLIELTLALSEQELTQTRTYPKLIIVLGDVGGLMEVFFSFFRIISAFFTDTLYKKSLVNHLFSFDVEKKLILIKNRTFHFLLKKKSLKIYENNGDNGNTLHNSEKNSIFMNNPNAISEIQDNNKKNKTQKKILKEGTVIKKKRKRKLSKNATYNNNNENFVIYKISNEKLDIGNEKNINLNLEVSDSSNRKFQINKVNKNNFDNYGMQRYLGKTLKETEHKTEGNIITKIQLNKFANYICFCKRKNYLGNILLTEGMKLIVEKLDIQNLFKKVYKEENLDEKNPELESIQMSELCKDNLNKCIDKLKNC